MCLPFGSLPDWPPDLRPAAAALPLSQDRQKTKGAVQLSQNGRACAAFQPAYQAGKRVYAMSYQTVCVGALS